MKKRFVMGAGIIGVVFIGAVAVGPIMSNVEKPKYDVTQSNGNIEIRRYEPMIIATVQVDGERKEAIRRGFRLLADYIFGANTVKEDVAMTAPVQQEKGAKIPMTAPVQQEKGTEIPMTTLVQQEKSTKIPMTSPVQQEKGTEIPMTSPVQQQSEGDVWQISFVMPSKYSLENLPKPRDERITLKKVPPKQFVAITFSGTNSDKNVTAHEQKLMAYVKSHNLSVIGEVKYAFYNPPWTLPLMRRNEVMIEIQP